MENEPLHILLADDDEGDRLLFTDAFAELEIETIVSTVNNGLQLMERLNMHHIPLPHFLFLDLNMPRKNGLDCLKEIRSNEKLNDMFIAIYSTSDSEKDMEETFRNGANMYITKPTDFNVLKQLLNKAVSATPICQGNTFSKKSFLLRLP